VVATTSRPGACLPAVVFSPSSFAALQIAGLSVLDRLLVTLHRAGAASITIIADGPLPPLKRTRALGITFRVSAETPEIDGPVLYASACMLVQVADVRRCLSARGSLLSRNGEELPLGIAQELGPSGGVRFHGSPLRAEGVACLVKDRASARQAEAELWASLTSASDGLVDKAFNRPCGRPLSRLLIHTPVSPNTVSVVSVLIGVAAALCFAVGEYGTGIAGAILFQISAIVDCVDGDLARVLFKESWLGKWLDLAGDQVVHVSVFAGIAVGVFRAGEYEPALWLGASAMAGALISFAVVLRGTRQPSDSSQRLQHLIDAATNRDFSVLVLGLACLGQLHVFLWMAAVGSHVFWVTALALQWLSGKSRRLAA
jgi:phosphatidylglycerophosphate synthase